MNSEIEPPDPNTPIFSFKKAPEGRKLPFFLESRFREEEEVPLVQEEILVRAAALLVSPAFSHPNLPMDIIDTALADFKEEVAAREKNPTAANARLESFKNLGELYVVYLQNAAASSKSEEMERWNRQLRIVAYVLKPEDPIAILEARKHSPYATGIPEFDGLDSDGF